MIDFKLITDKIREEKGYCLLHDENYATVTGIQIRTDWRIRPSKYNDYKGKTFSSEPETVVLRWIVNTKTTGEKTLQFLEGVTGYEEFSIKDMITACKSNEEFLWLCAGTPGKWDELKIKIDDLRKIIYQLKYFGIC